MNRRLLAFLGLLLTLGSVHADDRLHCREQVGMESREAKPKALVPGKTIWLKPGGNFSFEAKCLEQLPRQYRVHLTFYDGAEVAATADVLLARAKRLTLESTVGRWELWVD